MPSYTSVEDKGREGEENATRGRVYVRSLVSGVLVTRIRFTTHVLCNSARTHIVSGDEPFRRERILSLVSKMQESAAERVCLP